MLKYHWTKIKKLKSLKKFILDIFFPSFCVSCKKEGSFLCSLCKEKIEIYQTPTNINQKSKIKKLYCATDYKQKTVSNLIHTLKYDFIKETSSSATEILIKHLKIAGFSPKKEHIIIPVPLHKKRLKWRGFNQSEIIAEKIGKHFNIPVYKNILYRIKYTDPQTKQKDRKDRIKNIKNAFLCKNEKEIKNKEIILVDDVTTTGSTLKECAKALKTQTKKDIIAMVIAK